MELTETKGKTDTKCQGKTGHTRTQKKGSGTSGKRARQAAFITVLKAQRIFNIRQACSDSDVSRTQYYEWKKGDKRFQAVVDEIVEGRKDDYEEDLQKESRSGDSRATTFFLERLARDRGYGRESAENRKLTDILQRAKDGTISPLDAGYECNMAGIPLPEVLRLQLSKNEPLAPPEDENYKAPSIEEIERKAQEAMASQLQERTVFLPQRIEEVAQLKKELKDLESFGPNGENARASDDEQ